MSDVKVMGSLPEAVLSCLRRRLKITGLRPVPKRIHLLNHYVVFTRGPTKAVTSEPLHLPRGPVEVPMRVTVRPAQPPDLAHLSEVRRALTAQEQGLAACFRKDLAQDPERRSRYSVAFVIKPAGGVADVTVSGDEKDSDPSCVRGVIQGWRFPRVKQPVEVKASASFTLPERPDRAGLVATIPPPEIESAALRKSFHDRMTAQVSGLRACLAREQQRLREGRQGDDAPPSLSSLETTLALVLTIGPQGGVKHLDVRGGSPKDVRLSGCVRRLAQGWSFPALTGQSVSMFYGPIGLRFFTHNPFSPYYPAPYRPCQATRSSFGGGLRSTRVEPGIHARIQSFMSLRTPGKSPALNLQAERWARCRLRREVGDLLGCYRSAFHQSRGRLRAKVRISFRLREDGGIDQVGVRGQIPAQMRRCLRDRVSRFSLSLRPSRPIQVGPEELHFRPSRDAIIDVTTFDVGLGVVQ